MPASQQGMGNSGWVVNDCRKSALVQRKLVEKIQQPIQRKNSAEKIWPDLTEGVGNPIQMQPVGMGTGVVQLKKSTAMAYARKNSLSGIVFSAAGIRGYVNNKSNPKEHRIGLLRAWNKGLSSNLVDMPADLAPVSKAYEPVEDLGEWDSEGEDDWKMGDMTKKFTKDTHELERGDGTVHSGVPEMSIFDSIKFGRQVVKRDDYKQIPMISEIGGHKFEFDNPGTKDIYATPIDRTGGYNKVTKKRRYVRKGTSQDYNWRNLAKNLESLKFIDKLKLQRQLMRFFLKRGKIDEMYPEVAEALAAMGSDLMKGSAGGRFFLRLALNKLKKAKKAMKFGDLYSGSSPIYKPAAVGGRALVTAETRAIRRDANILLGINNCLINAISRAATGHNPTLGQIIRVREHFQNYGEMMLANGETIPIIRQALNIQNPIQVNYDHSTLAPPEDFPGIGNVLVIYHTGGNHFQENVPGAGKGSKKAAKH